MQNIIEEYIKKILAIGCNVKKDDNLIVYLNEDIPEFEEILIKLKNEYQINQLMFIKDNYEKIYKFLITKPTEEEIIKSIKKYPEIKQKDKVKIISISSSDYDGYYYKLNYEIYDLYSKYKKINGEINKEIYDLCNCSPQILITVPTQSLAKNLFGTSNKINELWNLVDKTIPPTRILKDEINRLNYIKDYLNDLAIRELYFYTDKGTDFKLKLTTNSVWVTGKKTKNNIEYFSNFPTYEIYTAPNYRTVEGKVIITKPSTIYGTNITTAELEFAKGKLVLCKSDNEFWEEIIMNNKNHLNKIGEIALVSNESPIAKLDKTFNSVLLDENAGCHLALGNSFYECIKIPKSILDEKGKRYYKFNDSLYHQDLIFGDDSITVEAKTRNKKILILEKGKWKI